MKRIIERRHRLLDREYIGPIDVIFTACTSEKKPYFTDRLIIGSMVEILADACFQHQCIAPLYCFMPDHLHVAIHGMNEESQPKAAFTLFKQRSGFWMNKNHSEGLWQKGYYDHIVRAGEDYVAQLNYMLMNPVRRNLCEDPRNYFGVGSIGVDIDRIFG